MTEETTTHPLERVTCLACEHDGGEQPAGFAAASILRCDECGARMAYGKLLPRIVVEPYQDEAGRLWIRQRFQDPKTQADIYVCDVDPMHAASLGKNLISLVVP